MYFIVYKGEALRKFDANINMISLSYAYIPVPTGTIVYAYTYRPVYILCAGRSCIKIVFPMTFGSLFTILTRLICGILSLVTSTR